MSASSASRKDQLLAQCADPLVYLLIAATVVALVAWIVDGAQGVPFDAIIIAVIIVANGVLGFLQGRKAEDTVAALQRMAAPNATVVRGGEEVRIPAQDVVPGDVPVLVLGEAAALTVAEAALTGESEPVLKDTAREPCVRAPRSAPSSCASRAV